MDAFIISFGQDTNGQNARFVQAARKYGHRMKSFAIGSDDPAGVIGRFQAAAAKREGLRIRSAHRVSHYFEFPGDIEWTTKTEPEIKRLMREADVIHLNNSFRAVARFTIQKPMLLHHHGSMFRNNSAAMLSLAKNHKMAQAVSTVDLMRADPDVLRWLPSAYDIDELQGVGKANRREPDGRIRIVHCPTNRALKHTDLFISIVTKLQEKYPIDLVIVEGQTNAQTLIEKAKADIVYDQIAFGYGCNSIEAWGLGVPVIAGGEPWTLNKMEEMWVDLPFIEATEKTLPKITEQMVQSKVLRQEYAQKGLDHVRKYHDERPALEKLMELYHEAIARRIKPRVHGKGVVFQYAGRKPEVVTDVAEVARLRAVAKRRPLFVKEIA